MRYLMDFLFGFLGFFVGWFVFESIKGWWNRQRQTSIDLQQEILKTLERPRKTPGRAYSTAEILAAARKE